MINDDLSKKKSPHFRGKYLVLSYLKQGNTVSHAFLILCFSSLPALFFLKNSQKQNKTKKKKKENLKTNKKQRTWLVQHGSCSKSLGWTSIGRWKVYDFRRKQPDPPPPPPWTGRQRCLATACWPFAQFVTIQFREPDTVSKKSRIKTLLFCWSWPKLRLSFNIIRSPCNSPGSQKLGVIGDCLMPMSTSSRRSSLDFMQVSLLPWPKNWDSHACQTTDACMLERARAGTPVWDGTSGKDLETSGKKVRCHQPNHLSFFRCWCLKEWARTTSLRTLSTWYLTRFGHAVACSFFFHAPALVCTGFGNFMRR